MHIGILLFDPPLIPRDKNGNEFEYLRDENIRPLFENFIELVTAPSNSLAGAASQPFLITCSLYRIVASEWVEMAGYINRELQVIEFNLEIAHHDIAQAEEYLVRLAAYRRRISCYLRLVREQLASIKAFGCTAWVTRRPSNKMREARKELHEDFKYVEALLETHSQRIDHNFELLLGLRGVYESRKSRILSRNMTSLALVGVLFLPFSSVASILSIQGDYGPGERRFWVYWAVSAPITIVLLIMHVAYSNPESQPPSTHGKVMRCKSWGTFSQKRREIFGVNRIPHCQA